MTREIKFRAWIPSIKSMVIHGLEIGTTEYGEGSVGVNEDLQRGEALKGLAWMQYTGLKDNNGVEIYEGDIVDFAGLEQRFEIIYGESGFMAKPEFINLTREGMAAFGEIIGNVWESPELLTDKHDK